MREMYKNMGICDEVYDYCDNIIKSLHDRFEEIDKNAEYNQMKVIKAMQDNLWPYKCILCLEYI